jgi:hypothetical protein
MSPAASMTAAHATIGVLLPGGLDEASVDTRLGGPLSLCPLLGKPLIERAVEQLVRAGCKQLHVPLGDDPEPLRALLGDGGRWGCTIRYHYRALDESLRDFLRRLQIPAGARLWVASGRDVPLAHRAVADLAAVDSRHPAGSVLVAASRGTRRWIGWGCFDATWLGGALPEHDDELAGQFADPAVLATRVVPALGSHSAGELLASARKLLDAADAPVTCAGQASVDPRARLIPPVYIGAHARIAAGAIVGPHAVVGARASIGAGCTLANGLVLDDTYVGADLYLHGVIARGNQLAHLSLDVVTTVDDPALLAPLQPPRTHDSWRGRVGARLLSLALTPLVWRCRTVRAARGRRVRAPWLDDFIHRFHPGLREVAAGRRRLVGPDIFAPARRTHRPPGASAPGLLSDALYLAADARADDRLAADALALADQNDGMAARRHLIRYLRQVIGELLAVPTHQGTPAAHPIDTRSTP